ncbi:MAG: cysteine--tRNA ligase [Bacilli bacterium]|nr:cysteine--tRNA ligase [Bacilli bacterium]
MKINFYNSLTNKVEEFIPQVEGKVSMYVCGPTVYNYPHIGNMRPVVIFDTLRRFLTYIGYDVTYVSNFTDVDDKIIKAAKEKGISEKELSEFFTEVFKQNTRDIGSMVPNITPKVTEYIQPIINYIDNLVKIGAAYEVDGDVYFRVSKIKDYGALSGINTEDLIAGARVEENSKKESPLDFALWKKTDEGIKWSSPWGEGRPGWHTECCVMIDTIFPKHYIDIHGGGYDLKFPHHENEIAQAEATHNNKIAKYWMHNGFINMDGEKMSKSLGNVVFAKDIIEKIGGVATRLVILNTHYRMPVNFTEDTVKAAVQEVNKMSMAYKQAALALQVNGYNLQSGKANMEAFVNALADDLNTANALSELYNVVKETNQLLRTRPVDFEKLNNNFKSLTDMFYCLGLDIKFVTLSNEDKELYKEYNLSKENKDFAKSDELRKILIEKGIM